MFKGRFYHVQRLHPIDITPVSFSLWTKFASHIEYASVPSVRETQSTIVFHGNLIYVTSVKRIMKNIFKQKNTKLCYTVKNSNASQNKRSVSNIQATCVESTVNLVKFLCVIFVLITNLRDSQVLYLEKQIMRF